MTIIKACKVPLTLAETYLTSRRACLWCSPSSSRSMCGGQQCHARCYVYILLVASNDD